MHMRDKSKEKTQTKNPNKSVHKYFKSMQMNDKFKEKKTKQTKIPKRFSTQIFQIYMRDTFKGKKKPNKSAVCLLVGCLTSQQQASVSQLRICTDNFTCCHTEIEVETKLSISPSHSILTPGRPVPALTL